MKNIRRWITGCVVTVATLVAFGANAQNLGCDSAVTLNGGTIQVASVSGDDTANIQCALDAATREGFRDVFLNNASYEITSVFITGFVGDLRGVSKPGTKVTVTDQSISCDDGGIALGFTVGNASVRNMTIEVGQPCTTAGGAASVIKFQSDPGNCSVNRTAFGNVDRVVIKGAGSGGADTVTGVLMDKSEACAAGELSQKVLGTLKVNRAELSDLDFGTVTSVGGGGQVDINFNTFDRVGLPITVVDASQNTSIVGNVLNYNDVPAYAGRLGLVGVFISSTSASPAANSTIIKGSNAFNDKGSNSTGFGILVGQSGKSINHSLAVTGNRFTGPSSTSLGVGIAAIDTSNGIVASNTFSGAVASWLELTSGSTSDGFVGSKVSGWAIVSNNFASSSAASDITFATNTGGNVVGSGQGSPTVIGSTVADNDVISDSSTSSVSSFSRSYSLNHASGTALGVYKDLLGNMMVSR